MAIAISEAVAEIVSTSNTSTYAFGSFVPTTNALLVVIAMCRGTVGVGAMQNTSGTALTWTLDSSLTWTGTDTVYIHWAKTPGSTAASVYTVSTGADAATGCIAYMFSITGHNAALAKPLRQSTYATVTSTNPFVTFAGALNPTNGYVAAWEGALSSSNPANVSAPPGSWTEIGDNGFATPTTNGSGAFRAGGESGTTVTFTAASTAWVAAGVEIYEASQGPAMPVFQTNRWKRHIRTMRNITT